jgi:hypothetical protein
MYSYLSTEKKPSELDILDEEEAAPTPAPQLAH